MAKIFSSPEFVYVIVQGSIEFPQNMTVCKLKRCFVKTKKNKPVGNMNIVLSLLIPVNSVGFVSEKNALYRNKHL